ncbi:MAG: hypothetical protein CVT47_00180 [Thermoplasmata archaeon HGW-Thermoplasmata-2]|nr:MAG: hypothetical protein CVT47_00180 [Thermoplasmata archaeon HGW-Thermoplasmata-2]
MVKCGKGKKLDKTISHTADSREEARRHIQDEELKTRIKHAIFLRKYSGEETLETAIDLINFIHGLSKGGGNVRRA